MSDDFLVTVSIDGVELTQDEIAMLIRALYSLDADLAASSMVGGNRVDIALEFERVKRVRRLLRRAAAL